MLAESPRSSVPKGEAIDKARFIFGFSIGVDVVDVGLKTIVPIEIPPENALMRIYSRPTPAFNVGIVANIRLNNYFDLRFIPNFSIAHDFDLYYQFAKPVPDPNSWPYGGQNDLILRKIECHFLNLPLLVKFKFPRIHNVRFYAIGGGQVGINLMSAKNNRIPISDPNGVGAEIIPIIKPYDIQVKGGAGIDFYTKYFKLATEFKVSFGVINMLEKSENIKNQDNIEHYLTSPIYTGLQSLKSRTYTISFIIGLGAAKNQKFPPKTR